MVFSKGTLTKCGVDFTVFTAFSLTFDTVLSAFGTAIAGAIGVALVNLVFVPLVKWSIKKIKTRLDKRTEDKNNEH